MPVRVAINGFGRIGRLVLRAAYESGRKDITFVAINDLGSVEANAHMLRHDTSHGAFPGTVKAGKDFIDLGRKSTIGQKVKVFAERDPANLPWKDLEIDVVLECTGIFTSKEAAGKHLTAGGARQGRRHQARLHDDDPQLHRRPADRRHAAQGPAPGARRGEFDDPDLDGRGQGRRPRPARTQRQARRHLDPCADGERLGRRPRHRGALAAAAKTGALKGILTTNTEPLVSIDFNHNPSSSVADLTQTQVTDGRMVRVLSWYDNEWGFSSRMSDTAVQMARLG